MINTAQFEKFYNFLVSENEKYNLTAITGKDEVFEKHFSDSISSEHFLKQNAKIIDVGTGAGFPAVPLKIIRKDLSVTMLDSVLKKINFVNGAIGLLGLNNTRAVHIRAEDFREKESFDAAVSRAAAPLNTLLEYLAPFVKTGGLVICYKGSNYNNELTKAEEAERLLGLELKEIYKYTLPLCGQERVLLVYKKISKTPEKYPRRKNLPRTKPL